MAVETILPEPGAADGSLVLRLQSISKSIRQFVGIRLAECEVLVGQDQLLLCLEDRASRPVAELANRLSVRASTVSKMADVLESKGWVLRNVDDRDARRVRIRLTPEGLRAAGRVRKVEARLEAELRADIDDDAALEALSRIDAVLSKRLSRLR